MLEMKQKADIIVAELRESARETAEKQASQIVARAREEGARIINEAEEEAKRRAQEDTKQEVDYLIAEARQ